MKKILLMLTVALVSFNLTIAQDREISGMVTDVNGSGIPGATVQIKGTNAGTATDGTGKFVLSVPDDATLIIRAIGFDARELPVEGQSEINVSLQNATTELNEIVVGAYGIDRSKRGLGYSVSDVNTDILTQKSEPDILKSMAGQIAGVDIRSSQGAPGAATRINMRGNKSFFGSNEPLIVVDGITYDNSVNDFDDMLTNGGAPSNGLSAIDPNDIESITVLKGATAAALYGSRASNGVLVVKTKSGSTSVAQKGMEVVYKSSLSFEKIASLPDYQNEYGAGSDFKYSNANGSWGPKFGTLDSIPTWPEYRNAFPDMFGPNVPYKAYPNNVKDLFQTGKIWDNSVSIRAGTGKSSVSATASLLQQDSYIPNSNFKRGNFSVGGVTELMNGLHVHANLNYSNTIQNTGTFGENQVDGVASSFARSLFLARNWDLNLPFEDADGFPVSTSSSQYDNPRWDYQHNTIHTVGDRVVANFRLDYDVTSWLNASYQLGANTNTTSALAVIDRGSRAAEGKGNITDVNFKNQVIESNFLLTFTPQLTNEDFGVKAILGHNVFDETNRNTAMNGKEIIAPGIYNIANTKTVTPFSGIVGLNERRRHRIMGVFANVELSYRDYLFLELSGRNDWSSTLPKDNRSFFYPAAAASFVFTDAMDLQSDVLSTGKIRASISKVGHDADPYLLNDVFVVTDPFLGQAKAARSSSAANPELKPEFTTEYELGTNLEFFKGRLSLDFAYYESRSTKQIAPLTLPPSTGYTSATANYGELKNNGVEIELSGVPIDVPGFKWKAKWTFTHNKTTVVSLTEDVDRIALWGILTDLGPYIEPGLPFGYIRGTRSVRDADGNLLIDPGTGLVINDPQEGLIGDPNPKFKTGLINNFSYKGFFLDVLLDYTHGGDLYSTTLSSELGRGVTTDTKDRENAWIIPGVYGNPNTLEPILNAKGEPVQNVTKVSAFDLFFASGGNSSSFAINAQTEWNVWDASVWHLRDLTFGYQFPEEWLDRTPFGSASISFSGRNLWYYAPNVPHASNFDPEQQTYSNTAQGFDFSSAPSTKRYGINLKVSF